MSDRRAFLRGLAALPLVGGSVALIGQPSAVAVPATIACLEAYKTFLIRELRVLAWDLADLPHYRSWLSSDRVKRSEMLEQIQLCGGYREGFGDERPASRAALVLSAVGASWREDA